MTTNQIERAARILAEHGDSDMMPLVLAADSAGWGDVAAYLERGYAEGLARGGMWQCEHCRIAVEDPAHPDHECGCRILDDGSGFGDVILCDDCHEAAVAARRKFIIDDDGVDDSNLSNDESRLAAILDRHDVGTARNARSIIATCKTREERRQLYRYQDQIDAARSRRGKQ